MKRCEMCGGQLRRFYSLRDRLWLLVPGGPIAQQIEFNCASCGIIHTTRGDLSAVVWQVGMIVALVHAPSWGMLALLGLSALGALVAGGQGRWFIMPAMLIIGWWLAGITRPLSQLIDYQWTGERVLEGWWVAPSILAAMALDAWRIRKGARCKVNRKAADANAQGQIAPPGPDQVRTIFEPGERYGGKWMLTDRALWQDATVRGEAVNRVWQLQRIDSVLPGRGRGWRDSILTGLASSGGVLLLVTGLAIAGFGIPGWVLWLMLGVGIPIALAATLYTVPPYASVLILADHETVELKAPLDGQTALLNFALAVQEGLG